MPLPHWLSKLEDIGKFINTGIEDVALIVEKFAPEIDMIPVYGPAIESVAQVVTQLESRQHTVTADDFQKMVQLLSSAGRIRAAVASPLAVERSVAIVTK